MGQELLQQIGFEPLVLGSAPAATTALDTRDAVLALLGEAVDLIVFVGGDGTARDVLDAMRSSLHTDPGGAAAQSAGSCPGFESTDHELSTKLPPVLGIPAGVKMHSSVFAVSPAAAGELLLRLVQGEVVGLRSGEVRDIDEDALRREQVRSRYYGELPVPDDALGVQRVKLSGSDDDCLVIDEIAEYVVAEMDPDVTYLLGPGTTTRAIMEQLGLPCTLLGVDVVRDGQLLLSDAGEAQLMALLEHSETVGSCLIVTPTGGQGSLLGRGNQQISPAVLRQVGIDKVLIVSGKRKLANLQGQPLLLDTGDPELDCMLSGYRRIVTGYREHALYPVGRSGAGR